MTKAFLATASVVALVFSGSAMAQDADTGGVGEDAADGNMIIVTATLREATLQEVPVAVSVISGAALDRAGVGAVDALVDVAPSLTFTKGANEQNSSLSIRGVGTTVFSLAAEPSTSVVVDGVVLSRGGMGFQDLVDIERVEVLRGPQSTLFGMNASAGVVSVTTKAPSRELSGTFDTLVTEDGEFRQRGTISGPIGDNAGVRLSGFYSDYDGSGLNFHNGERVNSAESWGLRGRLDVEPTDALELSVIADYRESDGTPISTLRQFNNAANNALVLPVVVGPENTDVNADGEIYSITEQWGVSGKAVYTFDNEFSLTSITAYREWFFDNNVDVDNTTNPPGTVGNPFTWNINQGTTDLAQISQEVRLASPSWDSFDFLIGAFFLDLDVTRTFARRWVFVPSAAVPTGGRSSQFEAGIGSSNLAGFVSGNVYPTEDLTIFGGLRLLRQKVNWSVFRDPANVLVPGDIPLAGEPGTAADFDGALHDTALTGNIGARYEIGDYGNVYASFSRGYKAGAYDAEFAAVETNQPVDPEVSDAFELGLKMSTLDSVLTANIALFYTKYRNYQAQSRGESETAPFVLRNAGEVSTRGVEAEFLLRPTDLLDISLGGAWIDARIDEFPGGPCFAGQTAAQGCVSGAQDLAGATLPNSPEWKFTASARQVIPLTNLPFDLFVQANGAYQTGVQYALSQDPRTMQEGYAIINAAIGIEDKDGHYSFQILGRNLTDQFYPGELFPSPSQGGRVTQNIARGAHRYFGVQGSISF
jgi:iron complex outermembrane receptor protein